MKPLTPAQWLAEYDKPGNYPVVCWKFTEWLRATPEPDSTTLKRWFAEMKAVYLDIPDEFVKKETEAWIGVFFAMFGVDGPAVLRMLGNQPQRRAAPVKEPRLDQASAIEVELTRRMIGDFALQGWFCAHENLLDTWNSQEVADVAWFLLGTKRLSEAVEFAATMYGPEFAAGLEPLLIGLSFQPPMEGTNLELIQRHWDLQVPKLRKILLNAHGEDKNPAHLRNAEALPLKVWR